MDYSSRVPNSDFSDAALMLVGHGSTLNAESALPTHRHADALKERRLFAQVLEAFWKEEPGLAGALRAAFARRVFVVPLFISEGYFTEQVIPREMGFCDSNGKPQRTVRRGGQTFHYCAPVGTHESMTRVIVGRAVEALLQNPADGDTVPADQTTLFIAGHGTGNSENSRKAIERQVELIRPTGQFADVHAVFMEEEPRIADCYTLAATRDIVMVPFFISDGLHSYEDIPVMLGSPETEVRARYQRGEPTWSNPTEQRGKRVWYTPSIGLEPHLPEVILERVREAVARETESHEHVATAH